MKKKLSVSFSGGRTSAFMAKWLIDNKSDEYEFSFIFANTGQEHEKTLEFVNECDKRWGLGVVWVEAVIDPRPNKGTRHKIVTFETAHRGGDLFDAMCAKYGLPGPGGYTHCNRELKLQTMKSHYKSIGWSDYKTAIGIRVDEIDRMNVNSDELGLIYPLISMKPTTKEQVRHWWAGQNFDLDIPEHHGNCKTCWKKSDRKLMTIAKYNPEWFDCFSDLERKYCSTGENATNNEYGRRFMFRKHKTCFDIIASSKQPFKEFVDHMPELQLGLLDELDESNGCSESCEIWSD